MRHIDHSTLSSLEICASHFRMRRGFGFTGTPIETDRQVHELDLWRLHLGLRRFTQAVVMVPRSASIYEGASFPLDIS